ncbi:Chromate transporter family protein [[Mycoplasma] cavipharyngis]|uniref:chromate transporter n=1 Tax=[Mycoplasma] cavipharyngis TaxID=92757 RepID=UPI003703FE63
MNKKKTQKSLQLKKFMIVFWFIIKTTFIGFGGGNALYPVIHKYAVNKYQWLSEVEFDNIVITSNLVPGTNVVQALSFIAIKQLGFFQGLIVTILGLLPNLFLAIGFYFVLDKLPKAYLFTINIAVITVIVGILIGFSIRYFKQSRQSIKMPYLIILILISFIFSFFVPSPFNTPGILMIGTFLILLIYAFIKAFKIKKSESLNHAKPKNTKKLSFSFFNHKKLKGDKKLDL